MAEMLKDPVCGMTVQAEHDLTALHDGAAFHFCSDYCRRAFLGAPEKYLARAAPSAGAADTARRIAYFSMELGLDSRMPTYSGGLGVLAGDTLRSAADLRVPLVGVSLLSAKGYFDQGLDGWGNQQERPASWDPARFARELPARAQVEVAGRPVAVRAWQHDVVGVTGYRVPVYLLDTDVEGNSPADRQLTWWLYGGDQRYRLAQEAVLGIGGLRLLRALGYSGLDRFHMNEGHAALLALELLRESGPVSGDRPGPERRGGGVWDFDAVRSRCVFTTHTPVPAGHDQFAHDLVREVLGEPLPAEVLRMLGGDDALNLTHLALNVSHYVNGVARRHGEVSQEMFPGYPIGSITNGVHSATWTCPSFADLYDRHVPGWRNDPASLRHAVSIPRAEVREAHARAKARLIEEVNRRGTQQLREDVLTIGFARRATAYKRADLVFSDLGQLADIARTAGPIQLVFAGKAHPRDDGGKDMIRRVFEAARRLAGVVPVVYLANHDMELGKLLTAGADLWLNTPLRPLEASGTSGMKAAHNGVPSLSILDGWWVEGHIEGVTGWSVGPASPPATSRDEASAQDARDLYEKLRGSVLPLFYGDRDGWADVMRQAVALNASFFNTHRMVQQYVTNAYV